mmetsp:Transcript_110508/g.317790  ORF Transcript_110508/g.317790 Transcript_110508/m.317790 type:complete len:215 (-) Transcript_110508:2423-3067(-)
MEELFVVNAYLQDNELAYPVARCAVQLGYGASKRLGSQVRHLMFVIARALAQAKCRHTEALRFDASVGTKLLEDSSVCNRQRFDHFRRVNLIFELPQIGSCHMDDIAAAGVPVEFCAKLVFKSMTDLCWVSLVGLDPQPSADVRGTSGGDARASRDDFLSRCIGDDDVIMVWFSRYPPGALKAEHPPRCDNGQTVAHDGVGNSGSIPIAGRMSQ